MENMTKYQFILLVLLVSFMTALVTGIVAVTLMSQAPPPITQTIQKVIERSIGVINPIPLPVDEAKQLEISATARDVLIEDIINRVSPAVVSIIALKKVPISVGSGFFVSGDGLILTNKHVVDDMAAEYTVITNSGKKMVAKVLERDSLNDMAVLKIDPPVGGSNYTTIALGDSDSVKIGQSAIVIGNALGEFQNTVSVGVISGLARSLAASGLASGQEDLNGVIQTDAAINPGNSGGPLLNLKGEVIGLNTAIAEGAQNIGFAIPINQIKRSLASVKSGGKIIYPFLGVRYIMVTPEIKDQNKLIVDYGALVINGANGEAAIMPGSPAEKAGIIEKDIILEFGGKKVTKDDALGKLIADSKISEKITLKILRDGKAMNIDVTLEERK
ncbi:MAG: trypsin-like peptidase domain-containing protein [bacterium]|nr:trypsin-like peptidase domain-containing protein [bacterium]